MDPMTQLLPEDRLRQIARVMALPVLPPGRLVPMLVWGVDTQTGRPVGRWVLSDEHGSPLTR